MRMSGEEVCFSSSWAGGCTRTGVRRAALVCKAGSERNDTASPERVRRVSKEVPGVSVRKQIAFVKKLAQVEAKRNLKPPVRTSFRRSKESNGTNGSARRRRQLSDIDTSGGKYNILVPPTCLIDGYNVIMAWPKLKKRQVKGDLLGARELLLSDVANFSHIRGWKCTVVFDAQGRDSPLTMETTPQGVDVIYTGDKTADSYIEARTHQLCQEKVQVWVATGDYLQQTLVGAVGALVMSSRLFIQEVKLAKRDAEERSREQPHSLQGKMLIENIDEDTRARLYAMRDELQNR